MISFVVNGKKHKADVDPDAPLLYVLRNDLGLNGPKFGCGLAQCGACTVIMNGSAILSCVTPVAQAGGRTILTLEGLGSEVAPHQRHAASHIGASHARGFMETCSRTNPSWTRWRGQRGPILSSSG